MEINALPVNPYQGWRVIRSLATPYRNEQFEYISELKEEYLQAGEPVISMDTKKKEMLGNFFRLGHLYTNGILKTLDHGFASHSDGMVIPPWSLRSPGQRGPHHAGTQP